MEAKLTSSFWDVTVDGERYKSFWVERGGGVWASVCHVHEYELSGVKMSTENRVTYKDIPGDNTPEGAIKAVKDALALAREAS